MYSRGRGLLGTKTKKDAINTALLEVIRRYRRRAAWERVGERATRGDFDQLRRDWEARKAAQHGEQ